MLLSLLFSCWTAQAFVSPSKTTPLHYTSTHIPSFVELNSIESATCTTRRSTKAMASITIDANDDTSLLLSVLEKRTVIELKAELKARGLTVSGTKTKLLQRLVDDGVRASNDADTVNETKFQKMDSDSSVSSESDQAAPDANSNKDNYDDADIISVIPKPLLDTLVQRTTIRSSSGKHETTPSLLPIQMRAYRPIASGSDAVLFAPTGSGKTLAYVLPLLARLLEWKMDGSVKKRRKRINSGEYFDSSNNVNREPAYPSILIVAPSRELAKQVGKVCSQYHPTSSKRVATVFGGVPIERHVSLLRRELDVVVGTPGRIRELIREGHLSTDYCKSMVLDEADVLLNFDDQPEIEMLLDGMNEDYQLVLASATVNARVREFVDQVLEMEESSDAFCVVCDDSETDGRVDGANDQTQGGDGGTTTSTNNKDSRRPTVSHWCTSARSSVRPGLASDIVATLAPRVGIVFVASKVEADAVAEQMADRLTTVKVSVLHGDMSQSARSRTVAALRESTSVTPSSLPTLPSPSPTGARILVATDVASRGLDLPGVDLVLQFGIPRKNGKDGTYDAELYTHRTGRAGRIGGGSRPADAILLYDPAQGEGRILPELDQELHHSLGISIQSRPLPSPTDVLEASFLRAKEACDKILLTGEHDDNDNGEFLEFFRNKIDLEMQQRIPAANDDRETALLNQLAAAMAALSGLGGILPERSLLSADPRDRTVRVYADPSRKESDSDTQALTPAEITRFVKGLGSGKLGRVIMCEDGSAVFDLIEKRALRLFNAAQESNDDVNGRNLFVELPSSLPSIPLTK